METPWTSGMDGAGHQFLSGTALASNQDRCVGRGYCLDGIENVLHGRALSNDVGRMRDLRDRLLQASVFLLYAAVRHGLADQMSDLVRIERLVDIVVGAVLESRNRRFH